MVQRVLHVEVATLVVARDSHRQIATRHLAQHRARLGDEAVHGIQRVIDSEDQIAIPAFEARVVTAHVEASFAGGTREFGGFLEQSAERARRLDGVFRQEVVLGARRQLGRKVPAGKALDGGGHVLDVLHRVAECLRQLHHLVRPVVANLDTQITRSNTLRRAGERPQRLGHHGGDDEGNHPEDQ